MSTQHQLWSGRVHTQIGRVRDATWTHGAEWAQIAETSPALYEEIRRLLDVFAGAPEGTRIR